MKKKFMCSIHLCRP